MKLATLCYIKRNGKTLMLHRVKKENDFHKGKRNGLGGKFENGESPEECAIREIKEESGLTIKNPKMKGVLTFPNFDGKDDRYVFLFTITDFDGELIDSPEGNLERIDDEKLLDLNLREGDEIFLKHIDNDGLFSGKFIYKDKKLISHEFQIHK